MEKRDELFDHDYDGIREYDNPLPKWWLYLLYGSILFSVVYVPYMHFGPGRSSAQEYTDEVAAAAAMYPKPAPAAIDLVAAEFDKARVSKGAATFAKLCFPCHRADAGGLVGPNLTDDYWIHGGKFADIVHTITEGVPAKGMISWKTQLSPEEIVSVAAYVRSLRGSNPPNPKPQEGELWKP